MHATLPVGEGSIRQQAASARARPCPHAAATSVVWAARDGRGGRGPSTAAESARAAPAPARVAAREVPFPACSALPIAGPLVPGQQNGRCSLATRHKAALVACDRQRPATGAGWGPKTSRARPAPRRAPRDRRAPGGWAPRRAAAWGHGVSPSLRVLWIARSTPPTKAASSAAASSRRRRRRRSEQPRRKLGAPRQAVPRPALLPCCAPLTLLPATLFLPRALPA